MSISEDFNVENDQLDALPIQIATLVSLLITETNPRLRIWISFELSEALVKWIFAVTAGAIIASEGRLSEARLAEIGTYIRRPTLGRWQALAHGTSNDLLERAPENGFAMEFAHLITRHGVAE